MKKTIFIFLNLCFLSFIGKAQKETLWDYPIKPGTEEWRMLKTNTQMVSVCQIPDNVLEEISTNDLMILCLQYPLLYDVFAFNFINSGLQKLFDDFNGIREFSNREDAINYLHIQYLSEIYSFKDKYINSTNLEIGHLIASISMLEVLICFSDFHNHISKENQKEILKSLLSGYKQKCEYPEYFQGLGFSTNLFARAHIIMKIDCTLSENFENKNSSVLFSGMANADLINIIDSLSYNLIK